MRKGDGVDTAVLVAIVAAVSAAIGALIEWVRKRNQDDADVSHTHVANSGEIVAQFRQLLDDKTDFLNDQIDGLKTARCEDRAEIERLRDRLGRLEDRLAAERQERAAAEALAAELDAELHADRQYIDVLTSLLVHHGIEVPARPSIEGNQPP